MITIIEKKQSKSYRRHTIQHQQKMSLLLRSNLFRPLMGTNNLVALAAVTNKPAVAVFSGKIPRSFSSMNPKRSDQQQFENFNADNSDESDELELGKTNKEDVRMQGTSSDESEKKAVTTRSPSTPLFSRRHHRRHHPFFGRFDDILARDPFFEPFHRDPFFGSRANAVDSVFDRMLNGFPFPVTRSGSQSRHNAWTSLLRSSPAYEIKETDNMYEVAVQIPKGLQAPDLSVEVDEENDVIHISGMRKDEESEGSTEEDENKPRRKMMSETRFDKMFRMDGAIVNMEELTANFSDGLLVLKVPKFDADVLQPKKTKVSITENPHEDEGVATNEEVNQKTYSDEFDESDWAETGKKKPAEAKNV